MAKIQLSQTGRGIVLRDGNILLMERWRDGLHYFSIPGGGVEGEETPEQTTRREILEETSIQVNVGRKLYKIVMPDAVHHIFLCEYISGEPHLGPDAPERAHQHTGNRFKPRWVAYEELEDLSLKYWEIVRTPLLHDLARGFSDQVTTLRPH